MYTFFLVIGGFGYSLARDAPNCVVDWGKCGGGKNYSGPTQCCNERQYCRKQDNFFSECVPRPLQPFPLAKYELLFFMH